MDGIHLQSHVANVIAGKIRMAPFCLMKTTLDLLLISGL